MTGDYHDYVFDQGERRLVGDFERMYRDEDAKGFDSWHERDLRPLRKTIALQVLAQRNFDRVLEVGCGKGTLTHLLKRANNHVVGVDMSATAIAKAKASFPDIEFHTMAAEDVPALGWRFDLIAVMGVFAYVGKWQHCLAYYARMARFALVAEYIPPDPIGHVKSVGHLCDIFSTLYEVENKIVIDDTFCILFGRSKFFGQERA